MYGIKLLPNKHTTMNASGVYLTTLPTQKIAQSYLRPLLGHSKKVSFISFQSVSDFFSTTNLEQKKHFKAQLSKRKTYFLSLEKKSLSADKLLLDFRKVGFKPQENVIINISDQTLLTIREKVRHEFFNFLNRISKANNTCFFIVLHGQESSKVNHWVMKNPEYFLGLSSLHKVEQAEYIYHIQYWIADSQVSSNDNYDVVLNDNDEFIVDIHESELLNDAEGKNDLYDNDRIYISKGAIDANQTTSSYMTLFDSNDLLIENIPHLNQSTVIFNINNQSDVHHLAIQCYRLRRKFGHQFKIILREMQQCLRYSDENFLSYVGINLIIPASVNFARFLSMVENLQKQQTTCFVPDSIEEILNLEDNIQYGLKGYVDNQRFVSRCQQLIEQHESTKSQFALVRLTLLPGIDAQSCLTMCNIKRDGDIVTACHDSLYLLLSSVRENDIQIALKHIFKLPVMDIFQSNTAFTTDGRVQMQLPEILAQALDIDITTYQETVAEAQKISSTQNDITPLTFATHTPLRF